MQNNPGPSRPKYKQILPYNPLDRLPGAHRKLGRRLSIVRTKYSRDDLGPDMVFKIWSLGKIDPSPRKRYANKLVRSFRTTKWFLRFWGRYPLHYKRNEDLTWKFDFYWTSPWAIYYIFSMIGMAFFTVLYTANGISLLVNIPGQQPYGNYTARHLRNEELMVATRNLVPIFIIGSLLYCITVSDIAYFCRRKYACFFFEYWTRMIEQLHLDVTDCVWCFSFFAPAVWIFISVLMLAVNFSAFAPVSGGFAGIFTILSFRAFIPYIHGTEAFPIIKTFCTIFLIYIFFLSKVHLFNFMYKCQILANLFTTWNERFEYILHLGEEGFPTSVPYKRTSYKLMFKDHAILISMKSATDEEFKDVIEPYLFTTLVSMVWEWYHLYRHITVSEEFVAARKYDSAIIGLYSIYSTCFLYLVLNAASEVERSAVNGLNVVRGKGVLTNKADAEVWFVTSCEKSFSGLVGFEIKGHGFIDIKDGFIITFLSSVLAVFIVLVQLDIPLMQMHDEDPEFWRLNMSSMLKRIEGPVRELFLEPHEFNDNGSIAYTDSPFFKYIHPDGTCE